MKGVFDLKLGSRYNDTPAERYHFPATRPYMEVALAVQGDWILYRETQRNGGRRAYIGAARVVSVLPDEEDPSHAYAYVAEFIQFDPPVAFSGAPVDRYWEAVFRAIPNPSLVGQYAQGKSLRLLSEQDFSAVLAAGIGGTLMPESLRRYWPSGTDADEIPAADPAPDEEGFVRRIETTILNRKVRDANFRRLVCRAYDDTCAVTGLRIINGGGRSEVQAAHIWPVEHGGPDVIQNALALSGTVHWLFDRHLISLTDDYRLLVARNRVPTPLLLLFDPQKDGIRLPKNKKDWPSPKYISRHRDQYGG